MAMSPVDQLPLSVPVFQILLSLVDQDLHGYAIIHDIDGRTGGEVRLTASTLYGALARMLDGGLVSEVTPEPGQQRRRQYRISRRGRTLLRQEAERLVRSAAWARSKHVVAGPSPSR
jgi:DNA-binding PadR family transcriptional regulator